MRSGGSVSAPQDHNYGVNAIQAIAYDISYVNKITPKESQLSYFDFLLINNFSTLNYNCVQPKIYFYLYLRDLSVFVTYYYGFAYKLCWYKDKFIEIIPSMLYTRYDLSHDSGLEHPL